MPETFSFLKHLDVPPAWDAAANRFLEIGGTVLVLGGPDTGKSTLCQYLIYRAYAAGEPAALLDLDLGQSHLGPPGALGLGLFPPRFPGSSGLFPEGLYCIGQTSPLGAILEVAVGCRVLADQARAQGGPLLVVNTSGLVRGFAAHRLKQAKMELLQPHLVLALAREGELSSLLRTLDQEAQTMLLPMSSRALRRSPEERRLYRETRFRRYFEKGQRLDFPLAQVTWQGAPLGGGGPLPPGELNRWSKILGEQILYGVSGDTWINLLVDRPFSGLPSPEFQERLRLIGRSTLEHSLLGLWDGSRRTLALGVLLPSPWQEGRVQVFTPLPASRVPEVKRLSLGRLKLSLSGRELTSPGPQS